MPDYIPQPIGPSADRGSPADRSPRQWLQIVRAGHMLEDTWRQECGKILDIYSARKHKLSGRGILPQADQVDYNILYANTQVLAAAIYSNPPRPDVRRRFRDKDPMARTVSQILERALTYSIDTMRWDEMMTMARLDYLLTGRAIVRVRYEPKFTPGDDDEPSLAYQTVTAEAWPYSDVARSAHTRWEDVEWVAFRHWMKKRDAESEFEVEFPTGKREGTYGRSVPKDAAAMAQKSVEVWEIWDKETRRVLWISEEDQSKYLREMEDPLRLTDFFPTPPPLYSVPQVDSLIPVPEYELYADLADEVQTLTDRMNRVERSIRVRGLYDKSVAELGRLFESPDTEMIASENVAKLRQMGGIAGAIWMHDNAPSAEVLTVLAPYRQQLIASIYEITGISDIVRGSTKATETATAQSLKARYGSLRIEPRQRLVANYLRDILRLWAEIIAEHFTAETLSSMTGVEIPLELWPTIVDTLRNELALSYRIDVQTDSTIADLTLADQGMLNELLQAVGSFTQTMAPLVQSGAVPTQIVQSLMLSVVRRAKLGPQVEDAIEQMVPDMPEGEPLAQEPLVAGGTPGEPSPSPEQTLPPPAPIEDLLGQAVQAIMQRIEGLEAGGQAVMQQIADIAQHIQTAVIVPGAVVIPGGMVTPPPPPAPPPPPPAPAPLPPPGFGGPQIVAPGPAGIPPEMLSQGLPGQALPLPPAADLALTEE